jgi:hypothetical protein
MTPEQKKMEQELFAAEHARREATIRGDVEAMTSYIADTFYYAHISGLVENREQFIARTVANPKGITFTSARDLAVQFRNGYALLTGKSRIDSPVLNFEALFLSVWEKGPAGWKMTAYASTPMKQGA